MMFLISFISPTKPLPTGTPHTTITPTPHNTQINTTSRRLDLKTATWISWAAIRKRVTLRWAYEMVSNLKR